MPALLDLTLPMLEQIYYIGELISVVAVVVSLIYVGIQVRQNTRAVKLNTLHTITNDQRQIWSIVVADKELSDLMFRAARGKKDLTGEEKFRYTQWLHIVMRTLENAYYQASEGVLESRNWDGLCRQYSNIMKLGENRVYWEERKYMYSEQFREFVDREFIATPFAPGYKLPGATEEADASR